MPLLDGSNPSFQKKCSVGFNSTVKRVKKSLKLDIYAKLMLKALLTLVLTLDLSINFEIMEETKIETCTFSLSTNEIGNEEANAL